MSSSSSSNAPTTTTVPMATESSTMAASTTVSALRTIVPILASTAVALSLEDFQHRFLWAVVAGFVTSFLLGFGMGANDVANAFGTSVGSKVLTLPQANLMATIMETAGAVLLGYNVVDTVRKGIVELGLYADVPEQLLVGQVAILGGCTCWLIVASIFRMPVSSSHAIVGSTLGFTLLMRGNAGIQWRKVGEIAISWFVSPLLSGLISSCIYMCVDFAVLRRKDPFKCGQRVLPLFYFLCFAFYTFMVVFEGSRVIHLQHLPLWLVLTISFCVGAIASLVYWFLLRQRIIKWAQKIQPVDDQQQQQQSSRVSIALSPIAPIAASNGSTVTAISKDESGGDASDHEPESEKKSNKNTRKQPFECSPMGFVRWFFPRRDRKEDQRTLRLFSIIQVVTGCFAGFSHGASDVSHTIAPLVALLDIYRTRNVFQETDTPLWMMFYGVAGTCIGFWALGHRVMKTIGKKITEINPCNGFAIEFGMAITVLVASKIGIPISSTHCLIGSVVFVGLIKAGEGVDWRVLINVALSWLVTLPVSALFAAAIMFGLDHAFLR